MASVRSWSPVCFFSALETKRSSDVTMFQRSSTHVMSIKHGVSRVFGSSLISFHKMSVATENLLEQVFIPKGPSPDVADRINASFSIYLQKPLHQRIVVDIANDDRSVNTSVSRVSWPPGPFSRITLERRWTGFVTKVSASTRVLKAQGSFCSCGAGAAVITLVRISTPHCIFILSQNDASNTKHRCRREPADNRRED